MMKLSDAQAIVAGALAAARENDAQPLTVIVLDSGGGPVAFLREDGASLFRFDIARAKAMGALGMGADTRVLAERAKANPVFFGSVSAAVSGNIAFSPGGILVRNWDGALIGSVGISGDTGEVDEQCAVAGIKAANLQGGGSA